jgi:hypothetical protein
MNAPTGHRCGDPVEVRDRFGRAWSSGFHVSEANPVGGGIAYRLRRADGSVVPGLFSADQLRPLPWEPVVDWPLPTPPAGDRQSGTDPAQVQ